MSNLNLYKSKIALNELDRLLTNQLELNSEFNYIQAYELLNDLYNHQSMKSKPWLYANPSLVEDHNWAYAVTLSSMRSTHIELLEKVALFLENQKAFSPKSTQYYRKQSEDQHPFITEARALVYEFTNFIRIEERLLIPLANKLKHYYH